MIHTKMFQAVAEKFATRFLNHWLQPYLESDMSVSFQLSATVLCAVIKNCVFSSDKINDLLSKLNLPFAIRYAELDELLFEFHISPAGYKMSIIVDGLTATIIPLEQVLDGNIFDSMKESYSEHKKGFAVDLLQQIGSDSKRYQDITAQETSKKLILSFNDITDFTFRNTNLRLELFPEESTKGIAIELQIARIRVSPEPLDIDTNRADDPTAANNRASSDTSVSRGVLIEGVGIFTDELTRENGNCSYNTCNSSFIESEPYYTTSTNPIKFASISGDIKLNVGYNDDSADQSSVVVSGCFSDICVFLTPRQVFLLHTLVTEVLKKSTSAQYLEGAEGIGDSYASLKKSTVSRTSQGSSVLSQSEIDTVSVGQFSSEASGWSAPGHRYGASVTSTEYSRQLYSRGGGGVGDGSSYVDPYYRTHYSRSVASEVPSAVSQSDITCNTENDSYDESNNDTSQYVTNELVQKKILLHVKSVCIVVLHEDVLVPDGVATYKELEADARCFFSLLETQDTKKLEEDITVLRKPVRELLKKNYFHYVANSISVNVTHEEDTERAKMKSVFRVHNMELLECCVCKDSSACQVELLTFKNDALLCNGNPCFNLSYETRSDVDSGRNGCSNSSTDLSVALANCAVEIDLSLVDRAEAFFMCQTFFDDHITDSSAFNDSMQANSDWGNETSVYRHASKMSCTLSSIDVRLRFPVPDLRPISDTLTKEIWKRNVRNDILTLSLVDLGVSTKIVATNVAVPKKVDLCCKSACLLFEECAGADQHRLALLSRKDEEVPISVVLEFSPKTLPTVREKKLSSKLKRRRLSEKYPSTQLFLEKNYVSCDKSSKSEPFLYPTDELSFRNFISSGCADADLKVTIHIPQFQLFLPSKHIYEVVYNRLAFDLLLWEPHKRHPMNRAQNIDTITIPESFLGDSMTASVYHSTCDDTFLDFNSSFSASERKAPGTSTKPVDDNKCVASSKTMLALSLTLDEGTLKVNTPCTDKLGHLMTDACGRILFDLSGVAIHVAAAYHGDKNKSYVGVYSKQVALSHHPMWTHLNETRNPFCNEMNIIIKKCTTELFREVGEVPLSDATMLSIVMDFDFDELRNINTMILSGKVNQAVYRYCMGNSKDMWVMQLRDMFTVQDYPISGYEMPEVVNDLHFRFLNCVLTYSPESLDSDAAVYVGSLIFASTLSYTCDISIFRMVLEDSALHIRKSFKKHLPPISARVVDVELVQLTIRDALRKVLNAPDHEFTIVAGLITLNTCTDSLLELINYVNHFSEPRAQGDDPKSSSGEHVDELRPRDCQESETELKARREMIADAVSEERPAGHVPEEQQQQQLQKRRTSMRPFVFPDDNGSFSVDSSNALQPQCFEHCTVLNMRNCKHDRSSFEKVCPPGKAWPLGKNCISKHSQKRASSTPVVRWHVSELSVCWKLCQGLAFSDAPTSSKYTDNSGATSPSSVSYNHRVSQISFNDPSPTYSRRERSKRSNESLAHAPLLEFNVKRLGYSFECFAPESQIACNHNLSIKDVEIIDLVPTSALKKLLCRYVTDEYPVGKNSNFLSINVALKRLLQEKNCEEYHLDISLGNTRMYIDQATVTFLVEFFKEISLLTAEQTAAAAAAASPVRSHNKVASSAAATERARRHLRKAQSETKSSATRPFFKSVVFRPTAVIIIDFEGNFSGIQSFNEILMALASANKLTLKLKEINFKRGILGVDRVVEHMRKVWSDDIYANQKMGLLKLAGPVGLICDIIGGFWLLFEIPFNQYMKDGNLLRGILLGSQAFTSQSVSATFGLIGKFLNCLESIASFLMVIVSPNHRVEFNQTPPPDAVTGVLIAGGLVRDRITQMALNVMHSTVTEHQQRGVAGAVSGFTRHIPEMALTPPYLAVQATGRVMAGLQHQWKETKDNAQKYK